MDPWSLTGSALQEPWRLWTGHLAHYGWDHALANLVACGVPLLLAPRPLRRRALASLLVLAPLLSLLLLPGLGDATYRGASGLACALWAWVGLQLAPRRANGPLGWLLLAGLGLKLATEAALGACFLVRASGWQALPASHAWGALLGLFAAAPSLPQLHASATSMRGR